MLLLKNAQLLIEKWDLLQTIGIFIILVTILTCVSGVVKNRYLHPLRHFPGPILASISPLYSFWAAMTEREHLIIEKLHKKYGLGPIVRYQPDCLIFADPKMIPVIYDRHADKTELSRIEISGEVPSVIFIMDHKTHAAHRKRIANPYSMSAARATEPIIDAQIIKFKKKLFQMFAETGHKMDFTKWTQFFAYDVISAIAFGKEFSFMESASDVGDLIESFHRGLKILTLTAHWDALKKTIRHHFVQRWLIPDFDKKIGIGRLCSERDSLIDERLSHGLKQGERIDMMQRFLDAKNADGSPMPLADVKAELLLIMFAGSDTTSTTMQGLLLNILQHEGCYEKLIAEIDDFVQSKGSEFLVISFDEAQSLRYLTACIKESMRFSPSTPILLAREAPKGGLTLDDGRYIPEGAKLSANSHVTQRNEEVYGEDAGVFSPDRWLKNETKNKLMEKYDLHFGAGTRVCLGKNIAMLEVWKASFEFFRTFKPTLVEPEKIKSRNLGLLIRHDLRITIEKRG